MLLSYLASLRNFCDDPFYAWLLEAASTSGIFLNACTFELHLDGNVHDAIVRGSCHGQLNEFYLWIQLKRTQFEFLHWQAHSGTLEISRICVCQFCLVNAARRSFFSRTGDGICKLFVSTCVTEIFDAASSSAVLKLDGAQTYSTEHSGTGRH